MTERRIHRSVVLLVALVSLAGLAAWIFGSANGERTPPQPDTLLRSAGAPKSLPDLSFMDEAGGRRSLADFRGRYILLNVWATWCAPCREEMTALDRLQAQLGGRDFEVVALSIDQQGPQAVRKFFDEMGIKALRLYIDPSAKASFKLGVVGVPSTLLVDRAGREIGRHAGPAKWDAPEVVAELKRRIETP